MLGRATPIVGLGEVGGLPNKNFGNYSRINNETVWINGTEHNILGVYVTNSDSATLARLGFSWECIAFRPTEMVL